MESLKDLARKKALNIFSFIVFVTWIIACCILAGVFILIEIGESKSDIRCDAEFNDKDEKELIREKCFDKYQEEYSKLPVFGFVFINCFILAKVPIIYSLCLKSRVDKLETPNQNVEGQPQQRRVLFTAYCCQLAATIVLATVFIIVLQTRAFHASTNFPSHFECNLLKQGSNSSAFSSTNGSQAKTDIYPCRNRRATKKCYGSVALTIFNGIWAFLAFIELFWILSRARNDTQFMDDAQFYVDHLRSNREQEQSEEAVPLSAPRSTRDFGEVSARSLSLMRSERPPEQQPELQAEIYADHSRSNREQEQQQQQSEEAVLLPALRSTRDLREVGARSLPEQHVVIELIPPTRSERTPEQQAEPNNSNLEQSSQVVVPLSYLRSTRDFEEVNARSLPEQQLLIEPTPLTRSERMPEQQAKLQTELYADYLRCNCEQELRPQQSEEAVLLPESDLRSRRDSGEVSARSVPEQHPVIEPTPLTRSERTPEQQAELQAKLESLKDCIKKRTERLEDLNQPIRPRPGEGPKPKDLRLDQIFVKLVIHDRIANYDFPKDRREQLKVFPKPKLNQSKYVPWHEIIDGSNKHILLVGRPGIGKTILSTKLLRGSAFNEFTHQNFDVAFLVKFRYYNSRKKYLDLRELLSRSETVSQNLDDEFWNYIITNPTKVLLIFDGIDEFNARSEISNNDSGFDDSEEEKMPLPCLYKKIASGKLLEGATVITTSRPTASSCVRQLSPDRVLEILGFTSEEVEAYVTSFTKEDQNPRAEKTALWEHISTNINLFTLCYIPVNCFIICSCLSRLRSLGISLPTKLTKIYSVALKIFYFRHSDKYRMDKKTHDHLFLKPFHKLPTECKEEFQRLGKLAFDGIKEGRLLFTSEEVEGLEDCGLLHRLPDLPCQEGLDEDKAQYCFIHLTFQELLAARHVVDTMTEAQALEQFITDHINEGSWQLVVQFVAGLLVDTDEVKQLQFSEILMKFLPMSTFKAESHLGLNALLRMTEKPTTFIRWPHRESEKNLAVTICKFLYELDIKQQSSIKRKMEKISFDEVNFSCCNLVPADYAAILHLLENCDEKFTLSLRGNFIGDLDCMEIKKGIVKSNCKGLTLASNHIREKGFEYLCDALKLKNCNLTDLLLADNNVGDKEVELLSNAIKDGNCKLTKLDLIQNKIRVKGVEHLKDALKCVNNNLTELCLAQNAIEDEGAKHLSDALKCENCKLTVLNLEHSYIGDKGAKHLSDALKDVKCKLSELNLRENFIREGVKVLSDALKDKNCSLTALDLGDNYVEDKGAELLRDSLKDAKCELTVLYLDQNKIGDIGAKHLSDAIKDGNCKLTQLYLDNNNKIGVKGEEHLIDAPKNVNDHLTELTLADTNKGDKIAEYLSDALKCENCKLTVLSLSQNNIGKKGAGYLSDALKYENCKLTELNLSCNGVRDQGAEYLSVALKDGNCKLTVLNLSQNNVGDKGAEYLSDALKYENCKLTELNLSCNGVRDQGAEYLSVALKDGNCKLAVLDLESNSIGDEGSKHLSGALKDTNHKLPRLRLSLMYNY